MAAFNKFQDFSEQLSEGIHNFASHTFKLALTNSAPSAANTVLADITQITAANGYPAGGTAIGSVTCTESAGTTTIAGNKVTFTASGGSVGPFRYVVMYNDTSTSDNLVGWWDYGSAVTLAAAETFDVKPSNVDTGGTILTVA